MARYAFHNDIMVMLHYADERRLLAVQAPWTIEAICKERIEVEVASIVIVRITSIANRERVERPNGIHFEADLGANEEARRENDSQLPGWAPKFTHYARPVELLVWLIKNHEFPVAVVA